MSQPLSPTPFTMAPPVTVHDNNLPHHLALDLLMLIHSWLFWFGFLCYANRHLSFGRLLFLLSSVITTLCLPYILHCISEQVSIMLTSIALIIDFANLTSTRLRGAFSKITNTSVYPEANFNNSPFAQITEAMYMISCLTLHIISPKAQLSSEEMQRLQRKFAKRQMRRQRALNWIENTCFVSYTEPGRYPLLNPETDLISFD